MAAGGADAVDELDGLLVLLRRLTPMPADAGINPTIHRHYADVVNRILALPRRDPRAIAPLLASLGPGEGHGVFERVIEHLTAVFPPETAGRALVAALDRGGLGARRWAAIALGRLAWEPAREALQAALEDSEVEVRKAADFAVRMLDAAKPPAEEDEGHDPLFEGLKL